MIKESTDRLQQPTFKAFFGIELTPYAGNYVTDIIESLRKKFLGKNIKWTQPEKLHTTVRFLGNITPEQSDKLIQLANQALTEFSPFSIRFSSLSALPNLKTPRIITLEPHPITSLVALSMIIDRIACDIGIPKDKKPFHPHLTLGKTNEKSHPDLKQLSFPHIVLKVNKVTLFRSDTFNEGTKHTSLATIPLLNKD